MKQVLMFFTAILISQNLAPQDWDDCASELERLGRTARNAADAAYEAESARTDYESKLDDYNKCVTYLDTYDLYSDDCQNYRWELDNAKDEYENALSNLESELSTLNSRIKNVKYSCEFDFDLSTYLPKPSKSTSDKLCNSLSALKGTYSDSTLLAFCKLYLTADSCKKCLGLK